MLLGEVNHNTERPSRTYLFEPFSFKPLALVQHGEVFHYHTDHIGTPREITNARAEVVWSSTFKTYGALALAHVNEVENPLRFQGQYYDSETGLHYNRHRYYDPNCGQFTTQDPVGLLGGMNAYQYAPNPMTWVDPWGLSCKDGRSSSAGTSGAISNQNDFNRAYGDRFADQREADAAWRVYQQSANSQEELVIGRLQDTEAGEMLGMRRLNDPDWTTNVNDAWIQGGIDANKPFYLGSNPTIKNLRTQAWSHASHSTTVTMRELKQLRAAGYQRVGNVMTPPGR